MSELKEYNNTIDGVNIESVDVVRDRALISKIVSEKISVLVIVNAAENQRPDSFKSKQQN